MKTIVFAAALAPLALSMTAITAAPAAADAPAAIDTKIDAVTVYPDRALVARTAKFDLAAGDARVRIVNLPARLTDRSVRVVVGGRAKPTLVGFSLATVPASEEVSPAARALEAQIKKVEAQDKTLLTAYQQVGDQRGFLVSMRSTFDPRVLQRGQKDAVDPKTWGATDDYLAAELARLLGEARRIDGERRKLAKELELLRKRMDQLAGKRGTTTKALTLDLRAGKSGKATLTLSYLVPSSSWRSLYDARLRGSEVDFLHYALVTQESGEDWDDVKLSVSTAVPSRHIALPTLVARNLNVGGGYGNRPYGQVALQTATIAEKSTRRDSDKKKEEKEYSVPPPQPEAEARSSEFVTTYDAATRVSVPSSPAGRKTAVGKMKLTTRLEHVAVPARAQGAYMTAVGAVPAFAPLPAGEVSLFFGDEYVGATHIAQVVPGGELRLPFGRDERVRVRRVQVERRREEQGIFSKREKHNLRYEIRVENQSGRSVDLLVLDQHPVAQHGEIAVELAEDTTPRATADANDAPGVLRWKLSLPAAGTTALKLGYSVSYPVGQRLYGAY